MAAKGTPAGTGARPVGEHGESCADFAVRIAETWAHDVRNPLTVIMGNADLLPEADEADRRAMSEEISRQCRYLEVLVREIPILMSLACGRYTARTGQENLRAILESAVRFVSPFMQDKNQVLRVDHDSRLDLVLADSACLELAVSILLFNMCRNASPSSILTLQGRAEGFGRDGQQPALELCCESMDTPPCRRPVANENNPDTAAIHQRANTRVEIARRLLEATGWRLDWEPRGERGCRFVLAADR